MESVRFINKTLCFDGQRNRRYLLPQHLQEAQLSQTYTAQRAVSVEISSTCCTNVRKISFERLQQVTDLEGHWRSLKMVFPKDHLCIKILRRLVTMNTASSEVLCHSCASKLTCLHTRFELHSTDIMRTTPKFHSELQDLTSDHTRLESFVMPRHITYLIMACLYTGFSRSKDTHEDLKRKIRVELGWLGSLCLSCIVFEIQQVICEKSQIFTTHVYLAPQWGWFHWNFIKFFGIRRLYFLGYQQRGLHGGIFSHFQRTPACDRQTDGHGAIAYRSLAYCRAVINEN